MVSVYSSLPAFWALKGRSISNFVHLEWLKVIFNVYDRISQYGQLSFRKFLKFFLDGVVVGFDQEVNGRLFACYTLHKELWRQDIRWLTGAERLLIIIN